LVYFAAEVFEMFLDSIRYKEVRIFVLVYRLVHASLIELAFFELLFESFDHVYRLPV
jgi:hypothetical protein